MFAQSETGSTEYIPQKIFQIESYGFDNAGNDVLEIDVQQGYLAVTPDFIAVTDDAGRVVFYVPSGRIKRVFSTGDAPAPAPDLSAVVVSGPAN